MTYYKCAAVPLRNCSLTVCQWLRLTVDGWSRCPPLPQIDVVGPMLIVWSVRGKIIRSVLCNIVCNSCAQCNAHTWTDLTVLWIGFCLTGPISLWLDSFLYLLCVLLYIAWMCFYNTVRWTWWDWSLILRTATSFSALTLLVGSFDP